MLEHIGYLMFGGALGLILAALTHAINDGRVHRGIWREAHTLRVENARLAREARQLRSNPAFADAPGDAAMHVQRMVRPDMAEALLPLRGKPDCAGPAATMECAGPEKESVA